MKKVVFSLLFVFSVAAMTSFAQAYKHSIGAVVGCMNGFSYKTFVTEKFTISVDLGVKYEGIAYASSYSHYHSRYNGDDYTHIDDRLMDPFCIEINSNFIYEANMFSGLFGMVGGGISCGYAIDYGLKTGINTIFGLEYKFGVPMTLQLDFRPGLGNIFYVDRYESEINLYFDWALNLGVRYTF